MIDCLRWFTTTLHLLLLQLLRPISKPIVAHKSNRLATSGPVEPSSGLKLSGHKRWTKTWVKADLDVAINQRSTVRGGRIWLFREPLLSLTRGSQPRLLVMIQWVYWTWNESMASHGEASGGKDELTFDRNALPMHQCTRLGQTSAGPTMTFDSGSLTCLMRVLCEFQHPPTTQKAPALVSEGS